MSAARHLPYRRGRAFRIVAGGALLVATAGALFVWRRPPGIVTTGYGFLFAQVLSIGLAWYLGTRYRQVMSSDCRHLVPAFAAWQRRLLAILGIALMLPAVGLALMGYPLFSAASMLLACLFFSVGVDPRCGFAATLLVFLPPLADRLNPVLHEQEWLPLTALTETAAIAMLLALAALLVWHGLRYAVSTDLADLQRVNELETAALRSIVATERRHGRLARWDRARARWRLSRRGAVATGALRSARRLGFRLPNAGVDLVTALIWAAASAAVLAVAGTVLFDSLAIMRWFVPVMCVVVSMQISFGVSALVSQWQDWLLFEALVPSHGGDPRRSAAALLGFEAAKISLFAIASVWLLAAAIEPLGASWAVAGSVWLLIVATVSSAGGLLVWSARWACGATLPLVVYLPALIGTLGAILSGAKVITADQVDTPLRLLSAWVGAAAVTYLAVALGLWLMRPLDLDRARL